MAKGLLISCTVAGDYGLVDGERSSDSSYFPLIWLYFNIATRKISNSFCCDHTSSCLSIFSTR